MSTTRTAGRGMVVRTAHATRLQRVAGTQACTTGATRSLAGTNRAVYYLMNCSLPTMPIFVTPSRCADAITAATDLYGTSLLGRRCTSA